MSSATYNPPIGSLSKWQLAEMSGDYNGLLSVDPTLQAIFDIKAKGLEFFSGSGTFARASVGNFDNFRSLLEEAAIDDPRLQHKITTGELLGMLSEEERENLFTYSNDFTHADWVKSQGGLGALPVITANAAESPTGEVNATRMQFDAGGNAGADRSQIYQILSIGTVNDHTVSVWLKSNDMNDYQIAIRFDNSIDDGTITVTPEWQRFKISKTSQFGGSRQYGLELRGATHQQTADLLVYGAQIEQGEFETSYIETSAASTTRNSDSAVVEGADFTGVFNPDEFVIFCKFAPPKLMSDGNTRVLFEVGKDANNYLGLHLVNDALKIFVNDGGVQNQIGADLTAAASTLSELRLALMYDGTTFTYSFNGENIVTENDAIPSGFTDLGIARQNNTAAGQPNSTIARLVMWPKAVAVNNDLLKLSIYG